MEIARKRKGLTIPDLSELSGIPVPILCAYESRLIKMTVAHRELLSDLLERDLEYFDDYADSKPVNIDVIIDAIKTNGVFTGAEWLNNGYVIKQNEVFMQNFIAASGMWWQYMLKHYDKYSTDKGINLNEMLYVASKDYLIYQFEKESRILSFGRNAFHWIFLKPSEIVNLKVSEDSQIVLIRDLTGASATNCFREFKNRFESEYRGLSKHLVYIYADFSSNGEKYYLLKAEGYDRLDNFEYIRKPIRTYRGRRNANDLPKIQPSEFFRCSSKHPKCPLAKGKLPAINDIKCIQCTGRMRSWKAWEWLDNRLEDEVFEKLRTFDAFQNNYSKLAVEFMEQFQLVDEIECDELYSRARVYASYNPTDAIYRDSETSLVNGNHRLIIAQRLSLKNVPYLYHSVERETDILIE